MEKHTKMNFISKALTVLALSATVSTSAFAADSVNTTGLAVTDTTVKVGILHSITGTMALSEAGSVQAEKLAIDQINKQGGVLGRKIEVVQEDCNTFQRFLRLVLDLDGKLDLSLGHATQICQSL